MPKVKISEYSATANSNTDVASINIDEGCAPSGINNAIRAVMGHLKDFQQGTNGDPFNGPVNGTLGATTAATANVTTLTTSSTVTHNGGTINGVPYLNGAKALTTGSALVFDGTNLGVGAGAAINFGGLLVLYGDSTVTALRGRATTGIIFQDSSATEQMRLTSTSLYTASTINVGIGTSSPSGKLDVYYNASAINPGATSGAAGNLRAGTGTFALTGANNRGIGTLINTNQNTNTTLPYGGSFETFGLLSVANAASGGSYTVYGVAGYSRSDGPATAFRADATQTTAGSEAYGYYVGTVSGGSTNYGVYVSDTSAKNYFGGNLLVGTTSAGLEDSKSMVLSKQYGVVYVNHATGQASGEQYAIFGYAGTSIGSITQNGTTSVNFNGYIVNPSDRKLKTNIVDAPSSLLLIDKIQIRSFNWVAEEKNQSYGVIAQELETVFPEAVNAPINEDGFYGVDYTKLVPMLVKAIQEQQVLITTLTARITALEGA
jgi:hypothetical protein